MKGKESSSPARATATQPWRGRGPIGWVINRLAVRCMRVEGSRAADQIIGTAENPYLLRWFILPRNRWFNIYYHVFCRSDDDRALHDHPWWNCSLLLDGEYTEHTIDAGGVHRRRVRQAGEFAVRGAKAAHRIELHAGPCRTLFITGPKLREWGFHCPQGWRHWRIFTSNSGNVSSVGLGCGEMDGAPAMAPSAQGGGMGARAPLAGIADAPPAFTVDQFVTGAGLAAEATRRADLDFSPSLVFMPPDPATDDEIVARFLADCTRPAPGKHELVASLWVMFCDWAGNARGLQPPLSRFAFRAALGRRFAFHDLDGVEGIEGLVLCEVRG